MSGYLLDVNVLIALIYDHHEFHERAESWFFEQAVDDWVTCPTTENGAIRVVAGPRFPGEFSHADVASVIRRIADFSGHRFIPDNISLLSDPVVDLRAIGSIARLTDTYLLSLAVHEDLVLATLDRRLDPSAVTNGTAHLSVVL